MKSRFTCDPWASHTRKASLGPAGMEAWGTSCTVTVETWSSCEAGLILQPWKASSWSRSWKRVWREYNKNKKWIIENRTEPFLSLEHTRVYKVVLWMKKNKTWKLCLTKCAQLLPQLISSEWSLQSGRPSQSTDTETHSSLCWHANWPGLQRCTVTFPPPEGDVVTLLGVTSSSTRAEKEVFSHWHW